MDSNPRNTSEEIAIRDAMILNLMGKLEVAENFLPRVVLDLASQRKLIVEPVDGGTVARIEVTRHREMGS